MKFSLILTILCFNISSSIHASELLAELNIIKERAPFPGYLYRPNDEKQHPAIILLHGSEGGNGDFWYRPGQAPTRVGENATLPFIARYFATLGYVTYAFCYFDCEHHQGYEKYPPNELKEVDLLHTTYKAIEWLKSSTFVQGKKLALWGGSRGAEQAIFLASQLAEHKSKGVDLIIPDTVIALSPYQVVAPSFTLEAARAYINGTTPPMMTFSAPWIFGKAHYPGKTIEIEHYKGPLLVSYFTEDTVWGPGADIRSLFGRYLESEYRYISINNQSASESLFNSIDFKKNDRYFIEFEASGHVFPPQGMPTNYFYNQMTVNFLKYFLGGTL
ncbi:MAG: hypothetical protein HOE90_04385 [Bacteriovoracaceae bacterium]|nr:hypothetical protein [Bacteriovoracaceae bacterium]